MKLFEKIKLNETWIGISVSMKYFTYKKRNQKWRNEEHNQFVCYLLVA